MNETYKPTREEYRALNSVSWRVALLFSVFSIIVAIAGVTATLAFMKTGELREAVNNLPFLLPIVIEIIFLSIASYFLFMRVFKPRKKFTISPNVSHEKLNIYRWRWVGTVIVLEILIVALFVILDMFVFKKEGGSSHGALATFLGMMSATQLMLTKMIKKNEITIETR